MGLHFILETYSFKISPPLPVVVRLSWEIHPAINDYYSMSIEKLSLAPEEKAIYSTLSDKKLRAPMHLYYLQILKDNQIYIPFEIYQNFEDFSLCSEDGLARSNNYIKRPLDISVPAVELYPGENGLDKYYEYFENLLKGLDDISPPLFEDNKNNSFDEEDSLSSLSSAIEEDENDILDEKKLNPLLDIIPMLSLSHGMPSSKAPFNLLSSWKEYFSRLDLILYTYYKTDYDMQESCFIFIAHLFVNNANFSLDEKQQLYIPSNPLHSQKNHSYFRTNKDASLLDKSKKFFKLKNCIFVNIEAEVLFKIFSNYFNVERASLADFNNVDVIEEPNLIGLKIILLDKKYSDTEIEGCYKKLANKKFKNEDDSSLKQIKQHFIFCYIEKIPDSNVYALCFPQADKNSSDRLNIVTSLGYIPDVITIYRTLFKAFKKNADVSQKAKTVFYQLWNRLCPNEMKDAPSNPMVKENDNLLEDLKALLDKNNLNNIYGLFIREIFEKIILSSEPDLKNPLKLFIFQTFHENLFNLQNAQTINDFIVNFQTFLDTLLLFLNLEKPALNFHEVINNLFQKKFPTFSTPLIAALCNYGMTAFSYILESHIMHLKPDCITVFNQTYFELLNNMDNLNAQVTRVKYTDDIPLSYNSLIFIDTHPNNAVETELYSHQIKKIFERFYPQYQSRLTEGVNSRNYEYYAKRKITIVVDVTLNTVFDEEVINLLKEIAPLIQAELVNLIMIQSLTKFCQMGADKLSAGALYIFNKGDHWKNFNHFLIQIFQLRAPDKLINSYFSSFYHIDNVLANYRNQITYNTRFVYHEIKKQLENLVFNNQLLQMNLTESIDNHSCYVSFNYRNLTAQTYQTNFITDNDITKFNKEIIKLVVELAEFTGIFLTKRQSIGFATCNINECDFAIRLTIGIEQENELKQLADILVYVCYALTIGEIIINDKASISSYLDKVKTIFYTCFSKQFHKEQAHDFELATFTIEEKIQLPEERISDTVTRILIDKHLTNVICILDKTGQLIYAKSDQNNFPVFAGYVTDSTKSIKVENTDSRINTSDITHTSIKNITRALISLFLLNHSHSKCKLAINRRECVTTELDNIEASGGYTTVIEITNFVDLNSNKQKFFLDTQQYGKLMFTLENNQLAILNNGHQWLAGNQVEIHRDVVENFGISFPHQSDNYLSFTQLSDMDKIYFFANLLKTKIIFENKFNSIFKRVLPIKINVESKDYFPGNGFILEYLEFGDEYYKITLNIFAVKPPILNLFCQYFCLLSSYTPIKDISSYTPIKDIKFADTLNSVTFNIKREQFNQYKDMSSKVVQFFLKMNREIRELFSRDDRSPNASLRILMEIKKLFDNQDLMSFQDSAQQLLAHVNHSNSHLDIPAVESKPTTSLSTSSKSPQSKKMAASALPILFTRQAAASASSKSLAPSDPILNEEFTRKSLKNEAELTHVLQPYLHKKNNTTVKSTEVNCKETHNNQDKLTDLNSVPDEKENANTHEKTMGDGDCFFHSAFATDKISGEWMVRNAKEMRQEWSRFLEQFQSLADPAMPEHVSTCIKKVLEKLFLSPEDGGREFAQMVNKLRKEVKQKQDLAAIKSSQLKNEIKEKIQNGNEIIKKAFCQLIIDCVNRSDASKESLSIQNNLRNIFKTQLYINIYPIQAPQEFLINQIWQKREILLGCMKGLNYLDNHIAQELKKYALLFNRYSSEDEYNLEINEEIILKSFSENQVVYKAYCQAILQQSYYVFSEEIPLLASLSDVTINIWYRERNNKFQKQEFKPDNATRLLIQQKVNLQKLVCPWINLPETHIYHEGYLSDGRLASQHYSKANIHYLELKLQQQIASKSSLPNAAILSSATTSVAKMSINSAELQLLLRQIAQKNEIIKENLNYFVNQDSSIINKPDSLSLHIAINRKQNEIIKILLEHRAYRTINELRVEINKDLLELDKIMEKLNTPITLSNSNNYLKNNNNSEKSLRKPDLQLVASEEKNPIWQNALYIPKEDYSSFNHEIATLNANIGTAHKNLGTNGQFFSLLPRSSSKSLDLEASYNQEFNTREKLSSETMVKSRLNTLVLAQFTLGVATGKGDCFFDSVAQALNMLHKTNEYTIKSLRLLCEEYVKSNEHAWVKQTLIKDERGESGYHNYLARIAFTSEEMKQPELESIFRSGAVWGRPDIEGRIICEKLKINLHIIEVRNEGEIADGVLSTEQIISSLSGKGIEPLNPEEYSQKNLIHLVNYKNHFVPLLPANETSFDSTVEPLDSHLSAAMNQSK